MKRKREDELQGAFSRRVFEEFYSMKEAFDKVLIILKEGLSVMSVK